MNASIVMETLTDSFTVGVVKKRYILGRNDDSDIGILNLGNYLALDRSTGSHVALDALKPHAILICGKRGYGKSYTMGTLIEELSLLQPDIRENIASLVIDTMGIFWTLGLENKHESELLSEWGLKPAGFDVNVFVPAGNIEQYLKRHIDVKPFSIPILHLDGYEWCKLFNVSEVSPLGVLLVRVIGKLRATQSAFSFDDVISAIVEDKGSDIVTKSAAENYFKVAISWGIFEQESAGIPELILGGATAVLDLSTLTNHLIRAAVVGIVGKDIYNRRLEARRSYERMVMGDMDVEKGIPMVWMFIDEAHLFVPSDDETLASNVLINEWLRQGRQPGLSIIFATQRPAAIHTDVISQCDVVICHRLTARDDISALEAIRPTYMREDIGNSIKKMGLERGIAFIVDDTSEAAHIVKMRPRYSWHGGNEPSAAMKR